MMRNGGKRPLCHKQTGMSRWACTPMQSNLDILCSSTYTTYTHSLCKWTIKALISLRKCAGWSGPSLSANCIRPFSCAAQHLTSTTAFSLVCLFYLGFTSLSTIFQSYCDGVWMWLGFQCSPLECCLTEISCPRHRTWYSMQSHYTHWHWADQVWFLALLSKHWAPQLAFYVNLHRAIIGPSATLTGRWRSDIDLRRMLTGIEHQAKQQLVPFF